MTDPTAPESMEITPTSQVTQEEIVQSAPNWYQQWRDRVHTWIKAHSDDLLADIVLFVPDLFMLTVRLIRDKRVPFLLKAQLMLSAIYVLSPLDLIPEALTGVIGLADDAGVLALTLYWLKNIIGIDPKILKDNWIGENDINDVIQDVHQRVNDNANKLFSGEIWQSIRDKFDKSEQEKSEHRTLRQRLRYKSAQLGKRKIPIDIE